MERTSGMRHECKDSQQVNQFERFRVPIKLLACCFILSLTLVYDLADCSASTRNINTDNKAVKMQLLHVALQEGFVNDTVVIHVDGKEIFHKDNVKTRLQIGFADSVEIHVQEGLVHVAISLPLRGLSAAIALQVSNAVYLGVSVTSEDEISHRISSEPFGYL